MEPMGFINNSMNTKICTCELCGKTFQKSLCEYNRKIKKNTPFYCSLKCSNKVSIKNNKGISNWNKSKNNFKHLIESSKKLKTQT